MSGPWKRGPHWSRRAIIGASAACGILLVSLALGSRLRNWPRWVGWTFTVEDRLRELRAPVQNRLQPLFDAANVAFPGDELSLLCFKDSRNLELHARDRDGAWKWIKSYPILAASGRAGPKLTEGDRQVPEGVYAIESLNPNSHYHLALRLNYPNQFDRKMAAHDHRTRLGGDIMIHGKASSIGCLAMGDPAIEELFVLAALVGPERVRVIICPVDFRNPAAKVSLSGPEWVPDLYLSLDEDLKAYDRHDVD